MEQTSSPASTPQPGTPAPTQPIKSSNGLAIAALIVSIVAFLLGWAAVVGAIIGVVGLVLGIVALKKKQNRAMSIVAIVLGSIAFISSVIFTIIGVALVNNAEFQREFQSEYNKELRRSAE